MKTTLLRHAPPSTLLARLIDSPDLVQTIRALAPPTFSALVRHVGVEDAGELIALATTDQLVAAFDEDLFVNARPGERETFDRARFIVWLEVLLEANDDLVANRIADLSEDFVVQALSSIFLVLDYDALLARMSEGGHDAMAADKAIESCLSEEIDGYLLISLHRDEGWDAALALILALDRDHRAFLERILNRCAYVTSGYIDDLEELATVLSAADSLADDVEAEREDRRSKQGYVEPRAARSFLTLARTPLAAGAASAERDPITRAYFRELGPVANRDRPRTDAPHTRLLETIGDVVTASLPAFPPSPKRGGPLREDATLIAAMRLLDEQEPGIFDERMAELVYLANVIAGGAGKGDMRFTPAEAAEAVLLTVELGTMLEAVESLEASHPPTAYELCEVLRVCRADALFRKASSTLVKHKLAADAGGFLRSREELITVVSQWGGQWTK